jgi:CRISPR-associated protein Csb3
VAKAMIPVDLRNPGQVFACVGFMEAAEILCGSCEGGFDYSGLEIDTSFTLAVAGADNPVERVLGFLARAEVEVEAPYQSGLSTAKWGVETTTRGDLVYPSPVPGSPATLPVYLAADGKRIPIEHWLDGDHNGLDNVKFWAGAGGYPGAGLARDALSQVKALDDNALAAAVANPFAISGPQSSSFRFDWRRDYVPMEVGFSPNWHSTMTMVGYPLVEILAAIGMQHARPQRPDLRNKLEYRYGVSNARLPTVFARAVLGAQSVGFPMRVFQMRLAWPGKENQARCIVGAEEENIQ